MVGTVGALLGLAVSRRPGRPQLGEFLFGLLNVPVAPSFVSFVVLALTTRALIGRKRVGLWLVAMFQVLGIYLGIVALLPQRLPVLAQLWRSHGAIGRGADIAGIAVGIVALWWLWSLRRLFPGRLQRGSWWLALGVLCAGGAITVGVAWLWVGGTGNRPGLLDAVVDIVLAAFGGISHRVLFDLPEGVVQVTAVLAGLTIVAAVACFLASAKPRNRWSSEREVQLRALLAAHGSRDSLGYFATRRDKASVFSPDGRAAVTYRVVAGVSLASADPIGDPRSWQAAIAAWRAEAHEYGWQPGVIGASEAGAHAFAAAGMRALLLGDEAVLEPARFELPSRGRSRVRHAAEHARRAGISVRVRRQASLSSAELHEITTRAEEWLGIHADRGFSMALGRAEDPADGQILFVTAHAASGELVGLLGLVPWGPNGVSLDLMRRSPSAPNGVTELMATQLLARADRLGLARVSLNFCMFRGVFEESNRIGGRSLTRLNAGVLGFFDRFWQLERLYRANDKYDPRWLPRFLCYDDVLALPQVAFATGAAEGFVPWPQLPGSGSRRLDPEQIAQIRALPQQSPALELTRSDHARHRLTVLKKIRDAGIDPYPAADTGATDGVDTVGRVRGIRNHGGVVFATLVDGSEQMQVLLDAANLTREGLTRFTTFVGVGDLLRVQGRTGCSRTGTPSVLVGDWRLEAKALTPVPFRSFTNPESRMRQRSLDLMVHPTQIELLRIRSNIIASVRDRLRAAGYLEVETPILQTVHGGATARPFATYSNAYGVRLSLRIAPELYLKRLLVAGMGPIFELGRNFRNEGADATHNPEFTSLEVYRPNGDYVTMRRLAEELIKDAARSLYGRAAIPLPTAGQVRTGVAGVELVDVGDPWPVIDVLSAVSEAVGARVAIDTDIDVLLHLARQHGVEPRDDDGPGAIIEALYGELVEASTLTPTFYTDFPLETSPLARPHRSKPYAVERWDLVIAGMEVGTAYTELTDPVDQRYRLTEQSLRVAAGDPEAMQVDEDFLSALELGMPPTGGLGIGIDRLVMLLTNTPIRSILTFPFVRPQPTPHRAEEPRWN